MSDLPLGLLLEAGVAVLLIITIAYCFTLNRRLKNLRLAQNDLGAVIVELGKATIKAENAIAGLKLTADEAGQELGDKLHNAKLLAHNLSLLVERSRAGQMGSHQDGSYQVEYREAS